MKKLILTGDDFGLSPAVNAAIEGAHRGGVLNTASLMVGARSAGDALDRARQVPSLKVGLHLVLVEGSPVCAPSALPDLVDPRGMFSSHLFRAGVNFFFRPRVRQQLEREIRAQFEAFQATGLALDHVNCHHHMHLHPTVGTLILKVGREFGLRAVRYPYEPVIASWRASRRAFARRVFAGVFLQPWLAFLKNRLAEARVRANDFVFGMNDSGCMDLGLVLRFLRYLPPGVTEIYFHPAALRRPELDRTPGGCRAREEFEVLTSPLLRQALEGSGIQRVAFSDL